MHTIKDDRLRQLVTAIFAKAGCNADEAALIGRRLTDANLVGHDSHGVVRVPAYVRWLGEGKVFANRHIRIVTESDGFAVIDGQRGFGQVIGGEAMDVGIAKAKKVGVAMIGLRHVHHLGRIGDWAEHCAAQGIISVHFVNGVHLGWIVAPFGGMQRRMTTNPFCCGMPVEGGEPIILDMATSKVAEGKVQVARNKGVEVPPGCLITSTGEETRDPNALYADPPGALQAFGDHKGYGLAVFCDLIAGALSGGGCNHEGYANTGSVLNNMTSFLIDPRRVVDAGAANSEVTQFVDWLKSSAPREANGEVLVPGEPERRTRAMRRAEGIPIDDTTWGNLVTCAREIGVAKAELDRLIA